MVAIQLNPAFAQAPIEVEIVGPPADHQIHSVGDFTDAVWDAAQFLGRASLTSIQPQP